jgi:hypothetical protein
VVALVAAPRHVRIIPEDHAFSGEPIAVTLRITNRKPLPLAWIGRTITSGVDGTSPDGFTQSAQQGLLAFSWRTSARATSASAAASSCAPGAACTRSARGHALRRPSDSSTNSAKSRAAPASSSTRARCRSMSWGCRREAARRAAAACAYSRIRRAAGIRDYAPGDSLRRIDGNATARLGRLQSRVYDPTSSQHLLLCLNTQTIEPAWAGYIHDLLERAITVAASIARDAYDRRYAVGLLANATVPDADRSIRIPPGRRPEQFIRMLEALALVTPFVLEPLAAQLDREEHRLTAGTTVVVITALMPAGLAASLQRLRRRAHPVAVLSTSGETWPELLGDVVVRDVSRVDAVWSGETEA